MKIAHLILLIPSLFILSCRKDDKIYEHIPTIPGKYKGECSYEHINNEGGGWSLYQPTITPYNYHSVMISYWPSGLWDIPLEVNKRDLTVLDYVDTVQTYYMGGAYTMSFIYRLNAKGEYEENDNTIWMDYILERKKGNPSEFVPVEKGYIWVNRKN